MKITLAHLWAVQILQELDMAQPASSIKLLKAASILCSDLTPQQIWAEMSYEELLIRLREAASTVVAGMPDADHTEDIDWSTWINSEVDAA